LAGGQKAQWSEEKARNWGDKNEWFVGCNFIPSTAINQIEMWQDSTWDPATIDRELGWASDLGFNAIRVYLHNLVYTSEKASFLRRIDEFLALADNYGIKTLFVFWDDCHYSRPTLGEQPHPVPGVHNSGWKQSPGYHIIKAYSEGLLEENKIKELEDYVKGVLHRFKNDQRILGWDLYNELGQSDCGDYGLPLLYDTWEWAWEVRPSQPLTACVNGTASEKARNYNREHSDIYTFHNYDGPESFPKVVSKCVEEANGRPVLCTEYIARPFGNTFKQSLPILKEAGVGAFCWGLVDGKTGTKWGWGTRRIEAGASAPIPTQDPSKAKKNPELWFHDVLQSDGTPYDKDEVEFLKSLLK
ncbi:MAG TPA: hypothetical protein VFD91_16915, partial [Mariniphaga sp.]|nr:hypothetical protein [Mariniphaga sp.]